MNIQQQWGWASFGKRDGFELLGVNAALTSFSSPRQLELLGQALQLRLEGVRIFPGMEVLGITRLGIGDDQWQFFTLYRYILDVYKRDGFYGASVGLRDAEAQSRPLLQFLDALANQTLERIQHRPLTVVLPSLEVYPKTSLEKGNEPQRQGFISFATPGKEEQLAFLTAGMQGKLPTYQRILGAFGQRIYDSVDEYSFVRFKENPFYKSETSNFQKKHITPIEEVPPPPKPIVTSSVVDAFEVAGEDRWKKNGNGHSRRNEEAEGLLDKVFRKLGVRK